MAGAATLLAALPAVPLGLWLALRGGGGVLGRVLLYAGLALPSVVVGLLFYLLLSRSGPLGFLGLLYTPYAMVLAEAVLAFPLIAAFVLSGARGRVEEVRLLVRSLGGGRPRSCPPFSGKAAAPWPPPWRRALAGPSTRWGRPPWWAGTSATRPGS